MSSPSRGPGQDRVRAALLAIGDEVLRGEIVNANAAYLSERLFELGIDIVEHVVVSDDPTAIRAALLRLRASIDVIIATGGLGPTEDDRTVDVVADLLGVDSPAHPASLEAMKQRFSTHGFELTPNNLRQVRVPQGGEALPNAAGIAPGFRINLGGAEGYFMPGVPREMERIYADHVAPAIAAAIGKAGGAAPAVIIADYYGMGESHIDHRLAGILGQTEGATLHFRTAFPENHVKLVLRDHDQERAQANLLRIETELRKRIGPGIYGIDGETFPQAVGKALLAQEATLSIAESCTGGMAGEVLTQEPGSSKYFVGAYVVYTNEMKEKALGVKSETLANFGAVSEPCAREMAEGVKRVTGSALGLSITGVAGPDGGSPEKPVGTVCMACAGPGTTRTATKLFSGDRARIRKAAAFFALDMARRYFDARRR